MLSELTCLNLLLVVAFVLGPAMVRRFFLGEIKAYRLCHIMTLLILGIGFIFSIHELSFAWLLFCFFGFLLFLKKNLSQLFKLQTLAESIPFVFSIIAAIWLFSGSNDLQLLGYNREWSYYAALHGNFLGWMLIGFLTLISRAFSGQLRNLYLMSTFLYLALFLLIAFGIDGVPYIKRIGATGVVLFTPFLLGNYTYSLRKVKGPSFYLSVVSLIILLFTLYLAAANELGFLSPIKILDVPTMVLLHGLLNGFVAIPSLYFALSFDERIPNCTITPINH